MRLSNRHHTHCDTGRWPGPLLLPALRHSRASYSLIFLIRGRKTEVMYLEVSKEQSHIRTPNHPDLVCWKNLPSEVSARIVDSFSQFAGSLTRDVNPKRLRIFRTWSWWSHTSKCRPIRLVTRRVVQVSSGKPWCRAPSRRKVRSCSCCVALRRAQAPRATVA